MKAYSFLLLAAFVSSWANAQSSDEVLALSYLRCAAISDFAASTIEGLTLEQTAAKVGWDQKRKIFIGSARLLTTAEFTRSQLIRTNEQFVIDFGVRKQEGADTETIIRQLMNAIDECGSSLQKNRERLLELSRTKRP